MAVANAIRRRKDFILLHYDAGQVTVETQDEDRFVISARKAVEACVIERKRNEAIAIFKQGVLTPLRTWCESHAGILRGCYIPRPDGRHLQVFVVGRSEKYDFKLGRELAKLELELFDAGWRVNVLQIPHCEDDTLRTYFHPNGALEVYAEPEPTPDQGKEQPQFSLAD